MQNENTYLKPAKIVSQVLKEMAAMVAPGVKTSQIDDFAAKRIEELGARSYNKGYKPQWAQAPYPAVACIGVNFVICHGIPSEYELKEGDIVTLDLGIIDDEGNCGDAALTVPVGEVENKRSRLMYYAKQTLYEVIKHVRDGVSTEDLAKVINYHAMSMGYLVNRRFGGHAIGKEMHMTPKIFNTPEPVHFYEKLKAGQVICIEPMLTRGKDNMGVSLDNGWTIVTHDKKETAMFEHMILVKEDGCEILTDHFTYERGKQ